MPGVDTGKFNRIKKKIIMDIREKHILAHKIEDSIQDAIKDLTQHQEPDYIAALTTGFVKSLPGILNKTIKGMNFQVGGCFIHQKPLAKFIKAPYNKLKSPEIGDLLIVYKQIKNNEVMFNALLMQAKKNNEPWDMTSISENDHQLTLYTKWPMFEYQRAGMLNGQKRSVNPKTCTPGAQYLLIEENNPPQYVKFYTAPSSHIIQASRCFAFCLVDFIEFHTGKPFVEKKRGRIDDWSQMIWDLISISASSVFNRGQAGYNNVNRYHGDLLQCFIQNSDIQNNEDIPSNDEGGISIIYIEGQSKDDNDIKRRERE